MVCGSSVMGVGVGGGMGGGVGVASVWVLTSVLAWVCLGQVSIDVWNMYHRCIRN